MSQTIVTGTETFKKHIVKNIVKYDTCTWYIVHDKFSRFELS